MESVVFKYHVITFICLSLIALSCKNSDHQQNQEGNVLNDLPLSISDSLESDLLDTIAERRNKPEYFNQKLALAEDSLISWGFREKTGKTFTTKEEYKRHWWLKIFFRNHYKIRPGSPFFSEYSSIEKIKQYNFTKAWKFVFEEWTFHEESGAERWLDIALQTSQLDNFKPPRIYWIEGNKMYFIMATAAADWFVHIDELVEMFTGKTRILINVMNEPVRLADYKKRKRGGNSGSTNKKSYFYRPDTAGFYYRYFWFHDLRAKYRQEAVHGAKILVYMYGEEIGTYRDADEDLISIKARINDPDLGILDLVGTDKTQIEEYFGKNYLRKDDLMVYTSNKNLLVIHIKNKKAEWFHYIKTNLIIEDIENLPDDLHNYD